MEDHRFDELTRRLATPITRRQAYPYTGFSPPFAFVGPAKNIGSRHTPPASIR